jgi:hypothetical protein
MSTVGPFDQPHLVQVTLKNAPSPFLESEERDGPPLTPIHAEAWAFRSWHAASMAVNRIRPLLRQRLVKAEIVPAVDNDRRGVPHA